ncbi:MAG: hypothetical protein Q4G47_04290 [Lachnospiraceae bacterium]|nr:hypothetical protein [Lachnospiraceae bacterium]
MSDDFMGMLGKKITKAVDSAVEITGSMVEKAKINSQISGERKEIDRLHQKIGESIMTRALADGLVLTEEELALAAQIEEHKERIQGFKKDLASVKGMKICPACESFIPIDVPFCPQCGAATPVPEEPAEAEAEAEAEADAAAESEV